MTRQLLCREELNSLIASLESNQLARDQQLITEVTSLALYAGEKLARGALAVDRARLQGMMAEALALLPGTTESVTV
jgi:flagellar biosynthesis/type III secretory pathway protein FliH